jgi:hypothetical protein
MFNAVKFWKAVKSYCLTLLNFDLTMPNYAYTRYLSTYIIVQKVKKVYQMLRHVTKG